MDCFIYKTTCTVSGKYYLGMHEGSVNYKYLGSGQILKASVSKHGVKSHVREVLHICENRDKMIAKEIEVITNEVLQDPLCMNLRPGGTGGRGHKLSEEAKQKIREANARRPKSTWQRGEDHPMFGKTHTDEVRENIRRAASKPKGPMSPEHRAKLAEASRKAYYARVA